MSTQERRDNLELDVHPAISIIASPSPTVHFPNVSIPYLPYMKMCIRDRYKTSAFILSELKKCGFRDEDIVSGIAGTGILVTIDSGKPGPVLALRADIDALEFIINGERKIIQMCIRDSAGH